MIDDMMMMIMMMMMMMIGRTLRDAIYGDIRQVERVVASDMFGTHYRRTGTCVIMYYAIMYYAM